MRHQSVQSLGRVQLFATPWTAAHHASLSITNSRSLLKLMSIKSVMPPNHLILPSPFPPAFNLSQHQGLFNEAYFQWVIILKPLLSLDMCVFMLSCFSHVWFFLTTWSVVGQALVCSLYSLQYVYGIFQVRILEWAVMSCFILWHGRCQISFGFPPAPLTSPVSLSGCFFTSSFTLVSLCILPSASLPFVFFDNLIHPRF